MSSTALMMSLDLLHNTCSVSSLDNLELEEQAMNDLLPLARQLARKYQNPYRWPLDTEEIFGECAFEIAKGIKHYLYDHSYKEFLRLSRKMLWNRVRELLSQAYGTKRGKNEYTAFSLPEERDEYAEYYDPMPLLFLHEITPKLSNTAKTILELILDPTEALQDVIVNHIKHRNTLYKLGGGMSGLPSKLMAQATGIDIKLVRNAYSEISQLLKEEDKIMDEVTNKASHIQFDKEFISWKDFTVNGMNVKYIRWNLMHLVAQATFRGIYVEGMKRSQVIQALRDDDKKHGIESDSEIPLLPEIKTEVIKDKVTEYNDDFDDPVGYKDDVKRLKEINESMKKDEEEFEKLPMSGKVSDPPMTSNSSTTSKDSVSSADPATLVPAIKSVVVVPFISTVEKPDEVIKSTNTSEIKNDLLDFSFDESGNLNPKSTESIKTENSFEKLLERMREGESLLITRLSPDEWQIKVVDSKMSENTPIKRERKQRRAKTQEFIESEKFFKTMTNQQVEEFMWNQRDVAWKKSNDSRINRMRAVRAYRKAMNIQKYNE